MKLRQQELSPSQTILANHLREANALEQYIEHNSYRHMGNRKLISIRGDSALGTYGIEEHVENLLTEHNIALENGHGSTKVSLEYWETHAASLLDFNRAKRLLDVAFRSIEPAFNPENWYRAKRSKDSRTVWRMDVNSQEECEEIKNCLYNHDIIHTRDAHTHGGKLRVEIEPQSCGQFYDILLEQSLSPDNLSPDVQNNVVSKDHWPSTIRSLDNETVHRMRANSEKEGDQIKLLLSDHGIEKTKVIYKEGKQTGEKHWFVEVEPAGLEEFSNFLENQNPSIVAPAAFPSLEL